MTFLWNGQWLDYFDHRYNHTALNMRRVEIPIARWFMSRHPGRMLEIGNVLAHYGPCTWPVVDLRERGAINADVMTWRPKKMVDTLVSISTIEHIGFGRYAVDGRRIHPAMVLGRFRSFLSEGGQALVTAPTGYNPILDAALRCGTTGADRLWFMRFMGKGEWAECPMDEAMAMSPRTCSGRWSGGVVILALDHGLER